MKYQLPLFNKKFIQITKGTLIVGIDTGKTPIYTRAFNTMIWQ